MTTAPTFTMTLPTWAIPLMETKIEKANRRALKAGLGEPFTYTLGAITSHKENLYGAEVTIREQDMVITGSSPSLPGWSFAAAIDWSLTDPVINTSPFYVGAVLPRPTDQVCEHCGKVRSRKETFFVVGPDGAVKQVGRQCLTVYTGIPLGWVNLARDIAEGDEDGFSWIKGSPSYDVPSVLALGIRIVDAMGYMNRTKADLEGGFPTVDRFQVAWHGPSASHRDKAIDVSNRVAMGTRSRSTEEVTAEAAAIIAWGATLKTAHNDYLRNLAAILTEEGWIGEKHLGYALSAIPAYRRHLVKEADRKAAIAANKVVEAQPVPVGRHTITGTLLGVEMRDSGFGPTLKAKVKLPEGGVIWGTLPAAVRDAVAGDTITFTATIQASDRDPAFGFYAKPTQASKVAA